MHSIIHRNATLHRLIDVVIGVREGFVSGCGGLWCDWTGDYELAVHHYTAAVRLVAAQWEEGTWLDVATLYSNRSAAFALLGRFTRCAPDFRWQQRLPHKKPCGDDVHVSNRTLEPPGKGCKA